MFLILYSELAVFEGSSIPPNKQTSKCWNISLADGGCVLADELEKEAAVAPTGTHHFASASLPACKCDTRGSTVISGHLTTRDGQWSAGAWSLWHLRALECLPWDIQSYAEKWNCFSEPPLCCTICTGQLNANLLKPLRSKLPPTFLSSKFRPYTCGKGGCAWHPPSQLKGRW